MSIFPNKSSFSAIRFMGEKLQTEASYSSTFGNTLNFNQRIQRIFPDSNRRACRSVVAKHLGVNGVHPLKISHILRYKLGGVPEFATPAHGNGWVVFLLLRCTWLGTKDCHLFLSYSILPQRTVFRSAACCHLLKCSIFSPVTVFSSSSAKPI